MASYVAQLRQDTVDRLSEMAIWRQVFDSRQPQITRAMLPCLRIYSSQAAEGRSINIPDFLTTTSLVVQIVADDITDAASAANVDEYCDLVKDRLLGDPEWLRSYERISRMDTEIERDVQGEMRTTIATITFALTISEYYEPRIPDTLEHVRMDVHPPPRPADMVVEVGIDLPPRPAPHADDQPAEEN